ncbi:hypothetical protein V2J09_012908 [Rumex salicifolius]
MEDVLTEIPPPSRFFQEELNNFAPPSPSLPAPFLLLSQPNINNPVRPSLLIIAISTPSIHIFHHVTSKTLIGTVILPEVPISGNSTTPSLKDKSCNIYSLDDTEKAVLLVSVQYPVPAERAHAISKVLLNGQIVPESVLILDSIKVQNFRGKLARDETHAYKLDTASAKGKGDSLLSLEYFPSGSVVDGLGAALLSQSQIRNIKGSLCVSWPEFGYPVASLIRSLLQKDILPTVKFSSSGDLTYETSKAGWVKNPLLDTELIKHAEEGINWICGENKVCSGYDFVSFYKK